MLNKLQERVPPPHTHKRKTVTVIYVRKHPILEMQLNTVLNSIFEIFICGITWKIEYLAASENEETFTNAFLCLSTHSQPLPGPWKGPTVHDHTCPCVNSSKWKTFSAFVANVTW